MIITYNHIRKADGVMHPRHAITQRCRLLILGIQSNYKQHIDSMTLTVCTQLIKREMFYENKRKYIDQYGLLRFAHAKNQLLTKKEKEKNSVDVCCTDMCSVLCSSQTHIPYGAMGAGKMVQITSSTVNTWGSKDENVPEIKVVTITWVSWIKPWTEMWSKDHWLSFHIFRVGCLRLCMSADDVKIQQLYSTLPFSSECHAMTLSIRKIVIRSFQLKKRPGKWIILSMNVN